MAKQHERGKLTARERIELLLDPGSFTEFKRSSPGTAPPTSGSRPPGPTGTAGPGTAPSTGVRFVFSQDFTVFGGSLREVYGEKIVKIMDHALEEFRLPMGVGSTTAAAPVRKRWCTLGLFAEIFYRNVMASASSRRSR